MYTTGNSDQARAAIERGLDLEESFGDRRRKTPASFVPVQSSHAACRLRGALKVAQQSATFAETAQDPAGLLIADFMLGGRLPLSSAIKPRANLR